MSSLLTAHAGAIDALTGEQRLAAAARTANVFIEAGPGTGKTTVSAQRFGVQRFGPEHRHDHRAVVAVSFTRAATSNLRRRVQRLWGPSALSWPHRIVTLDTVMNDLLHSLIRAGLVQWPRQNDIWKGGPVALDVHDSWAAFGGTAYTKTIYTLTLVGGHVVVRQAFADAPKSRVPSNEIVPRLMEGICTHDDVRTVLGQALRDPASAAHVKQRLANTMRALIVDEAFDANDLDIEIIEAAINAGVAVTLVGDPWQALYAFRGARPQAVPELLQRTAVQTLPLTQSFRWRSDGQRDLALSLRAGDPVALPSTPDPKGLDVVLALKWQSLWDLGAGVLPLAFHSFKGNGYEEAAATLVLNHVTRAIFDVNATYLNEAITALAFKDRDTLQELELDLQRVIEILRPGGKAAVKAAYEELVRVLGPKSPRFLRAARANHTGRLDLIQQRLALPGRPVPGLTTHQAKGGEWEVVGVRLSDGERAELATGLSHEVDTHRMLYVACTRAHRQTIEVAPPANAIPAPRSRRSRRRS